MLKVFCFYKEEIVTCLFAKFRLPISTFANNSNCNQIQYSLSFQLFSSNIHPYQSIATQQLGHLSYGNKNSFHYSKI